MKIISIGDLVTDYYYKNGKLVGVCGGMSSHNIIANIAKMDLETAVYGVCGKDDTGNIAMKSLSDLGVNVENVDTISDIKTRCFHVSYEVTDGKLSFTSKKRCPKCNGKNWYDESKIDPEKILSLIQEEDVLVFDNLNFKNQEIIDKTNNKCMLDLGQYFELENYTDKEIIDKLSNKFHLINLNERVEKYLLKRFSLTSLSELYNLLKSKMIIVTRGSKGTDFVFNKEIVNKKLANPAEEVDSTGAGDSFFAMFISEYVKNNYVLDNDFIDNTFIKATKLTSKVVREFGARGHLQKLYKIKKKDGCTCNSFELIKRRSIKRCNINVNNLEVRVINALNSGAYEKLERIDFTSLYYPVFIGTGGSFAGAKFASKLINVLYGINSCAFYPRDLYYHNNSKVDGAFLFSYSGTTNDILVGTSKIDNEKKFIITKGELSKIHDKTGIEKSNILTYRTSTNKGKERGFLSFEGALVPASLFLKYYFIKENKNDIEEFIKDCINYWKSYFKTFFEDNKETLNEFLALGSKINIFTGDNCEVASTDLESKFIESGVYECLVHEKKNFSHGRFINYEHLSGKKNIYFKQKSISKYEESLLEYLKDGKNLVIESRYDGILCEYDLLVASQILIYYISNFIDIDLSKPSYSDDAMKIYFYKGEI